MAGSSVLHCVPLKSESESHSVASDSLRPPGLYGILQARIPEWVAFPFSRDLPNPGIKPRSPALQADCLPAEPQGTPTVYQSLIKFMSIDVGDDI